MPYGRQAPRHADTWLWLAAAASLALSLTSWGPLPLYPFKLFTTWIHECSHAVMTLIVGGRVTSITIAPDTSGLTRSLVPAGRISQGLVASAGYLGASVVGCLLLSAARVPRWTPRILGGVGAFMVLTLVLWIRNAFGAAMVASWAIVLLALARRSAGGLPRFVLSLLAIQVALNAVFDIRILFLLRDGPSDAKTMARLFLLPAWCWAVAWMAASALLVLWTLSLARRAARG